MVFPRGNKFSLVVAVDNPLHVSLIVTISDKSILVDEIGWKFLHGNLYRYPCLALPWLTCCCWWMLAAWLSRSTCSVSWSSRWWRLASNISRGGWGPGECNDCCSDEMMVGVIQVRGENYHNGLGITKVKASRVSSGLNQGWLLFMFYHVKVHIKGLSHTLILDIWPSPPPRSKLCKYFYSHKQGCKQVSKVYLVSIRYQIDITKKIPFRYQSYRN